MLRRFDITVPADQSALRTHSYLIDIQFSSIQFTSRSKKKVSPGGFFSSKFPVFSWQGGLYSIIPSFPSSMGILGLPNVTFQQDIFRLPDIYNCTWNFPLVHITRISPLWMNSTTFSKSASFMSLDVSAGVPSLKPPGRRALLSPGHVFLLTAILISSSTFSARAPSQPVGRRSTSSKWLSVPPTTITNITIYSIYHLGGLKWDHCYCSVLSECI